MDVHFVGAVDEPLLGCNELRFSLMWGRERIAEEASHVEVWNYYFLVEDDEG